MAIEGRVNSKEKCESQNSDLQIGKKQTRAGESGLTSAFVILTSNSHLQSPHAGTRISATPHLGRSSRYRRLPIHGSHRAMVRADLHRPCRAARANSRSPTTTAPTIRTRCACSKSSPNTTYHATFFLIGRYVKQRPDFAREIAQAGHIIGNHTFTHPLLIFKSEAEIRQRAHPMPLRLEDAVGATLQSLPPTLRRTPPAVLRIARELGLEPVMWNVTGYDWNAPPAAAIEHKVANKFAAAT